MKKVLIEFLEIDAKVMTIVNNGLVASFLIGLIGLYFILAYNKYGITYDFLKAGLILAKAAMIFSAEFIGTGFAIDKILKRKI